MSTTRISRYWLQRVPAPNPNITDPIWPGDPFWRSKKYPRELRAAIAREWHEDLSQPSLHALSVRYGVPVGSLTLWCYAYPFGQRELTRRNYTRRIQSNYFQHKDKIDAALAAYHSETAKVTVLTDPTWRLMGDPLPSRSASQLCEKPKETNNISLPPLRAR